MHACALAEELDMRTVIVPRASGVLSALGLAISDVRRDDVRPYGEGAWEEMEKAAREELSDPALRRTADLRYRGQSFELTVEADDLDDLEERFHQAHEQRYGYRMDEEEVERVNARLIATVPVERPELREEAAVGEPERGERRANFDGEWVEAAVLDRDQLGAGSEVSGPAIVEFREATCVVRPGWSGRIDEAGSLVLERDGEGGGERG
jgi:N-methylhydantoinase A